MTNRNRSSSIDPAPGGPAEGTREDDAINHFTRDNLLLSRALDAVDTGNLEAAQEMLESAGDSIYSLGDVFRLYQSELETRAQQLTESQERTERTLDWFACLFQTLPVAAMLVDNQGLIVDANNAARDAFALHEAGRAANLALRRLLADPGDEIPVEQIRRRLTEGATATLADVALADHGQGRRWADLWMTRLPLRDGGEPRARFLCVVTDRTEHVEAQRAREAALAAEQERDRAEDASRAMRELMSRVSHELRTPLNAVLGFSQLLLMPKHGLDDESTRRVEMIHEAGRHLLSLVDEVLQLNRAGGPMQEDQRVVDLLGLADEVLRLHETMASPLEVSLSCQVQPEQAKSPHVRLHARRAYEVLVNLVSNAIKYNRRGGWVTVTVGRDDRRAWFDVADSGIGMVPAQVSQLFQPFNRLGADRLGVPGHGLGLSIARAHAVSMGGTLEVQSEADVGTRFRFVLPVA